MPEGPEVKRTTDFLSNRLMNDIIVDVKINSGRYLKHGPFPGFDNLKSELPAKVTFVSCKGKFIWIELRGVGYLSSTLGMSGSWSKDKNKHSHISLVTSNGDCINFHDPRNFGTLRYFDNQEDFLKKLNSIGPDLLSGYITKKEFYNLVHKNNRKTIVEVLMNQKIVSGIGNYLKAECLYESKISPHRLCSQITQEESDNLFHACRKIIRRSYESGGATISTYRQPNGEKGLYSRRFAVYNQKHDPFGHLVVKEKTLDKRTTHWVPEVQK